MPKRRTYSVRAIQRLVERLDDDIKMMAVLSAVQRSMIYRRWRRFNSLENCAGFTSLPLTAQDAERLLRQHIRERVK